MLKFAHIIPFYPLFQMIRVQAKYGILSNKKWQLILIWLIKLTVIEPFRMVEAIVMLLLPKKKVNPIFILGYYRSGTTYLQELLASDKNHRTLTLFQSVLPEVSLCFGWLFVPILSFITMTFRIKNPYHNIDFSWIFPGEEDVAINAMMAVHDYNKIYQYPSKHEIITDHYLNFKNPEDSKKWMANYRYLLKKLAYCYGDKKLVLKSPPNTGRIDLLKNNFPDAKFIFIHRDPFVSISSARRLWKLNLAFSFEAYSEAQVENILIKQYECIYELFKNQNGFKECTTVTFEELVHDASKTMEFIYTNLKLEGWNTAKPMIDSVCEKRKQNPNLKQVQAIPLFLQQAGMIKTIRRELGYC